MTERKKIRPEDFKVQRFQQENINIVKILCPRLPSIIFSKGSSGLVAKFFHVDCVT